MRRPTTHVFVLLVISTLLSGCFTSYDLDSAEADRIGYVTAGFTHSCAYLGEEGPLYCWGQNSGIQLGGDVSYRFGRIKDITAGESHMCVVHEAGTVTCWGDNALGQLGRNSSEDGPAAIIGLENVVQIAAGNNHTCVLLNSGTIRCWGANQRGQLGNGTATGDGEATPEPVPVSGITDATFIAAGHEHTCAVLANGTLSCWGGNGSGQLGDGSTQGRNTPGSVSDIHDAISVAGGSRHTCAVRDNGAVKCWGSASYGEIGLEPVEGLSRKETPVDVEGPSLGNVTQLALGEHFSCALDTNQTVHCWGYPGHGRLGVGTSSATDYESWLPQPVAGLRDVIQISARLQHVCALRRTGQVFCWGNNEGGQLGPENSGPTSRSAPVEVHVP